VTGDEVTDDSETDESNAVRSRSFDAAAPGYVAPPGSGSGGGGWLSGFLSSADADVVSASIDSVTTASSVASASGNCRSLGPNYWEWGLQCQVPARHRVSD